MFFGSDYIQFEKMKDTVALVDEESTLPIVVMSNEHKSVRRAAGDLQTDIEKVTGQKPALLNDLPTQPSIIVGTVDNKELLDSLKVDSSDLEGKWESFTIQTVSLPGIEGESVLILGSDKRGAIYGIYDITERMGVSPWYWWMDVPVKKHKELYIEKGKISKGEPSVEYRGFFLNDEGPSLMTWVRTHFPDFTHEFYEKIFELTLRLKGNYHWPAMWDSTFYEDDEENIQTADLYGVVIGTSHHEPMDRPHGDWKAHKKGPWEYSTNEAYLKEFWTEGIERSKPYETIINLGMRGDGDEPMGGDLTFQEKIKLMEKIIQDQREIIQDTMDVSIEDVPQMWALYKEVKEYYDSGMEIPEDVTLLWGDDNFGNIRRLPTKEERQRKGGAGIYYHFDYVGGPRSYKWVNTVPIQKTYEQMHKAYEYDARKVWIVNVGDLKPMEYQTEFFLRLAWDVEAFNPDNLEVYAQEWAEYTFGESFGKDVARVIRDYVKFNGRLKPEILNITEFYSWENEYEAERVLEEFEQTVQLAERVYETLPNDLKEAFYQVAYYPAKASYTVLKLQLYVNLAKHYKKQNRIATNVVAAEAKRLFEEDKQLTYTYNKVISDGKWDHMMDQIHIGYTYWQQPDELLMPEIETLDEEDYLNGQWGVQVLNTNQTDRYTKKPLFVEVYNKGLEPVEITVATDKEWIKATLTDFSLSTQQRIRVDIDWEKIEYGMDISGSLTLSDSDGATETVTLHVHNPESPLFGGYVPIDGKIAIEAEDYTDKKEVEGHRWQVIPDYGRTKSSMAIDPVEYDKEVEITHVPQLSYDIVLDKPSEATIKVVTAPSLPFDPKRGMRLGVSVDEGKVDILHPGDLSQNGERDSKDWEQSVIVNAHVYESSQLTLEPGKHTVHLSLIDPQVVIQKVIIDLGGEKPTLLGPEPTPHADRLEEYSNFIPKTLSDYSIIPGTIEVRNHSLLLYAKKSGFYTFDDVVIETVDNKVPKVKDGTLYLSKGFHTLGIKDIKTPIDVDLTKETNVSIHPTVRLEETEDEESLTVHLVLHYDGSASTAYHLDVELLSEGNRVEKVSTKGILKTDEQRLVTHVFDYTNEPEIQFNLTVDGWKQSVTVPIEK